MVSSADGTYTLVTWFYAGDRIDTTEDVMAECAAHGATFVAP
jgi:hypothetical protein